MYICANVTIVGPGLIDYLPTQAHLLIPQTQTHTQTQSFIELQLNAFCNVWAALQ